MRCAQGSAEVWRWPRRGLLVAAALLAGCGGGWNFAFSFGGNSCAVAPTLVTQAPKFATVGQAYVVQLQFGNSASCTPWPGQSSCYFVTPVQLPAGASFDAQTGQITWVPTSDQASGTASFQVATVTYDCSREVAFSWAVFISL